MGWKENNVLQTKLASPCYKCQDRKLGCHGKCVKYIKYRTEYDELNKQAQMDRMFSHGADNPKRTFKY